MKGSRAVVTCIGLCIFVAAFHQMIGLVIWWPLSIVSVQSGTTRTRAAAAEGSGPMMSSFISKTQDQLRLLPPPQEQLLPIPMATPIISCDRSNHRYDLCSINGPTVLDPTTSTFFASPKRGVTSISSSEKIKPYPRKFEDYVMGIVKEVTLTSGRLSTPPCQVQHDVPALVFSAGGYTGNVFHDFNDGFIPLFITVNSIFPNNQDFVLVISEAHDWWISKYGAILKAFSKHPIIALNNEEKEKEKKKTHCFPSATLGLISHGFMTINQTLLPNSKTYIDFRSLLHNAFGFSETSSRSGEVGLGLGLGPGSGLGPQQHRRPRLVLASRNRGVGRAILNEKEMIRMMKKVGFEVVLFKPTKTTWLRDAYALIESSHVMVGVHGAALTHALFLRPRAVLVQVVPIGVEWAAGVYFGMAASEMKFEYIEYRIGVEESSLVEKYGKDNVILKNPFSLQNHTWSTQLMDIYLKEQNVKLDLVRFKRYLLDAYKKAKRFMYTKG